MAYTRIYKMAEAAGISEREIAVNLRNLVGNTLLPIKKQYDDLKVNKATAIPLEEGFSMARNMGQAVVLQFTNHTVADYPAIAIWIRNNVPLSQLQLQYFTVPPTNRISAAIGVAWGSTNNVPQICTTFNGKVMTLYIARYNKA